MKHSLSIWLTASGLFLLPVFSSCSHSSQAQEERLTSGQTDAGPPSMLAVRTTSGFVGISRPSEGQPSTSLVPFTTRSERRVCASVWMQEAEFLTVGGPREEQELQVRAIAHAPHTEMVQDERGMWEIGEPLPWGSEIVPDPLPWIRRDGHGNGAESLLLPALEEDQAWVLFPMEADWFASEQTQLQTNLGPMQRPATRSGVWILQPKTTMRVELRGLPLDALRRCTVQRIPDQAVQTWKVERVEPQISRIPSRFSWQAFRGEGPPLPTLHERNARTLGSAPWHAQATLWRVRVPAESSGERAWTLELTCSLQVPSDNTRITHQADSQTIEASSPNPSPAWFSDQSSAAGLSFLHLEGPDLQLDIRPTMGPGAAVGDMDGDGWPDVYLVQGGSREGWPALGNRLYKNQRDGTFLEVGAEAGVADTGAGMGALFFDADGDRDLDLYVANYGPDKLFQNQGDGTFEDISEQAGLSADLWSAAVTAADFDGDGDLDLYVTSYLDYDLEKMPPADELDRFQREDPIEMLPFAFPGQRNLLLRNDSAEGGLRFVDVAKELGVQNETGLSMQAVWWDFDQDLDPDLYIANDVSPNVMFLNKGDGTFEDITFAAGLDDPRGGMGLDLGDVDQDGDEDVFLSNWQLESNALYLNQGARHSANRTRRANFRDGTIGAGLGPSGVGVTSWGVCLFDLELDGDLDLFVANGYTSPDYTSTGICVGQANHLFLAQGRGRYVEASAQAGAPLLAERASRCAIPVDYDRDGDLDLLVTANNGWVQLLHNQIGSGRSLNLELQDAEGNSFGVGARVEVQGTNQVADSETAGPTWTQSLRAGMGYLGGNAPELHFGLGQLAGPLQVRVTWRNGTQTEYSLPVDVHAARLLSDGKVEARD